MGISVRVETIEGAKEMVKASVDLCRALSLKRNLEEEIDLVIGDLDLNLDWVEEVRDYGLELIKQPHEKF